MEILEKVTKRGGRSEKVIQKERGLKRMKERMVLVRLKVHWVRLKEHWEKGMRGKGR